MMRVNSMTFLRMLTIATLIGALSLPALAQSNEQPADEPAQDAPPSLDDLLGLEEDSAAEETAQRVAEEQLQQRLTGQQIANAFEEAITNMRRSADLLDARFDTGVGTQRIQQDVLAKLQQLIDEARRQQSSSSSSSSSQQQQQQQRQQQSDPGRQQQNQKQQQQQQQEPGQADGSQEVEGPAMREGDVGSVIEETRSEWGSLPQRVRDMLLQGREERFSSLYEQMTREYYRRLAEE